MKKVSFELKNSPIPILRKDFILDPVQIKEAIAAEASAVLLIVAVLKENTKDLLQVFHDLSIDAIVEVHNRNELNQAVEMGADIIGVNNRDLTTFSVDPENALKLQRYIPDHIMCIAESGINTAKDAKQYISAGYNAVLIGGR